MGETVSRKTLRDLASEFHPLQTSLALSPLVQRAVQEWARYEVAAQSARSDVLAYYPGGYCGAAPCGRKAIYTTGNQPQRLSALCETEAQAWISAAAVLREANYRASLKPLSDEWRAAMQAIIRRVRKG